MAMKRKNNRRDTKASRVIDIDEAREERRRKRALAESKKKKKVRNANPVSKRRSGKTMRRRTVYTLIVGILLAIIGFSIFNLVSLKMEEARVQAEYEALLSEKAELEEELSNVDSDEYIEQQAREELKMILPGETLYIISDLKDEKTNENKD